MTTSVLTKCEKGLMRRQLGHKKYKCYKQEAQKPIQRTGLTSFGPYLKTKVSNSSNKINNAFIRKRVVLLS